ncbi:hypothetical protein ACFYNF_34125 [Streptomyces sp. NPDC006641]|uniref:hypothetical protein n=1 Tax=unclassified Streptomyces TaxID=2593676 RepID=UPI0036C11284
MSSHRDVAAIAKASNYEKHGTTFLGGSFTGCICPRAPCGGVAESSERMDCPHHRKAPAQLWHWVTECPGT